MIEKRYKKSCRQLLKRLKGRQICNLACLASGGISQTVRPSTAIQHVLYYCATPQSLLNLSGIRQKDLTLYITECRDGSVCANAKKCEVVDQVWGYWQADGKEYNNQGTNLDSDNELKVVDRDPVYLSSKVSVKVEQALHPSSICPIAGPSDSVIQECIEEVKLETIPGHQCTEDVKPETKQGHQCTEEVKPETKQGHQYTEEVKPEAKPSHQCTEDVKPETKPGQRILRCTNGTITCPLHSCPYECKEWTENGNYNIYFHDEESDLNPSDLMELCSCWSGKDCRWGGKKVYVSTTSPLVQAYT